MAQTGENKNYVLVGYLTSLVGRGVIGNVEIQFMPIGHTHILIDQVFSKFAEACKLRDIFTRLQQAEAFRDSCSTLPVITTTLWNLGNFKSIFQGTGVVYRLSKVTKARAFQQLGQGTQQVAVGMKEYMHHEDFTGMEKDGSFKGDRPTPVLCRWDPQSRGCGAVHPEDGRRRHHHQSDSAFRVLTPENRGALPRQGSAGRHQERDGEVRVSLECTRENGVGSLSGLGLRTNAE
ncbi:unnamed protein product [Pylaiella littoralis]